MLRINARRIATIAVMACIGALALGPPAEAQSRRNPVATAEPEPLVENEAPRRRARPRVRVQPLYPYRTFHTTFPLPYDIEYPGPGAKRYCTSRLVTEHRLSGTVIVPRMRCWWARG
jgi:hypothetical protein